MTPAVRAVANDAHLVQLVRGSLGRDARTRGFSCPNVSSRKLVVTLHGRPRGPEERGAIEETVRGVPGVRDVVNKIPET